MDVDSPAVVPVVLEIRSMKGPKTLHDPWKEYECAFHDCKPVKDRAVTEGVRDKFKITGGMLCGKRYVS